jgi:hypothetical protein
MLTFFKALEHARTEWNVHMISLSFGYDSPSVPDNIWLQIDECLKKDIMIFASASNDAGEGARTYPGKYEGVICVHSATAKGNRAKNNPSPYSESEKADNFITVGDSIKAAWPSKSAAEAGGQEYKSGTSFATPVAVSIAAFMISYVRKKLPEYPWRVKPWSPSGMTIIFRMMTEKRDGYDWVSPKRYLRYASKDEILVDLKRRLK